jgi:hypothetical protein
MEVSNDSIIVQQDQLQRDNMTAEHDTQKEGQVSNDSIIDVAEILSMIAQDELNNCHNMGIFKAESAGLAFTLTLYLHAIRLHLFSFQFHRDSVGYSAVHLRDHLNIYRALKKNCEDNIDFKGFTSHYEMQTNDSKKLSMTNMISHMFRGQAIGINSTLLLLGPSSDKKFVIEQLAEKIKERIEGNNYTNSAIFFVDVIAEIDTTVTFPNRVLVTAASVASNGEMEQYLYQTVGVLYRRTVSRLGTFMVDEHFAIQMVTRDGNSVPGVDYRQYKCNSEETFYKSEEKYQTPEVVAGAKTTKGRDLMHFPFPSNMIVFKPHHNPKNQTQLIVKYQIHGAVLCLNAGQNRPPNRICFADTDSFSLTQDEVVAVGRGTTFQLNDLRPLRQPAPFISHHLVLSIIHRFAETINQPQNFILSSAELEPLCEIKYHTVDDNGLLKLQESLNKEFCDTYENLKRQRGEQYRCIYTVEQVGSVFHAVIMCGGSWVFVCFCLTEKWIVVNDPEYNASRSLAAASGILHFIYLEYKTFTKR